MEFANNPCNVSSSPEKCFSFFLLTKAESYFKYLAQSQCGLRQRMFSFSTSLPPNSPRTKQRWKGKVGAGVVARNLFSTQKIPEVCKWEKATGPFGVRRLVRTRLPLNAWHLSLTRKPSRQATTTFSPRISFCFISAKEQFCPFERRRKNIFFFLKRLRSC